MLCRYLVVAALWLAGTHQATGGEVWTPAGEPGDLHIEADGGVRLAVDGERSAGVLSAQFELPPGCDALWVDYEIEAAGVRSFTLAALDAVTGESLAYYQNPLPVDDTAAASALLRLSGDPSAVRLFAGTHGRSSTTRFRVLAVRPVRSGIMIPNTVYGARIGDPEGRTARQVFTATGHALEGVVILLRPWGRTEPCEGLQARLHAWEGNLSDTLAGPPLAETFIPDRLLNAGHTGESRAEDHIEVTYEGGRLRVALPLRAATVPGNQYLLDLFVAGEDPPERGYLSYAWVDSYEGGFLFDGTRQTTWDLFLETYDAEW